MTFAQAGDDAAILMGRLYYREPFRGDGRLACRPPTRNATGEPPATDAALALAAYRQGGAAALERLEGDFARVVWDAARSQLLCTHDPLGGYPLF